MNRVPSNSATLTALDIEETQTIIEENQTHEEVMEEVMEDVMEEVIEEVMEDGTHEQELGSWYAFFF